MRRILRSLVGRGDPADLQQDADVEGPLSIREMTCDDLDRVMRIERSSFTNPWSRRDFLFGLRRPNGFAIVALYGGALSGYAVGFVRGAEFHLANLAIESKLQRRGYGSALLAWILRTMRRKGTKLVSLEARSKNAAAIGLYEKHGFRKIAMRKGYYSFPEDDAFVMIKVLEEDQSVGLSLPDVRAREGV